MEHKVIKKEGFFMNQDQTQNPQLSQQMHIDTLLQQQQYKISIENIDIWFPIKPYDSQIDYMNQTIKCLNNNQNGLLQSPTGTGKTLSLLCSSLAWLKKQKEHDQLCSYKIIYSTRTHQQLKQVIKELKRTIYRPNQIILASKDQYCLKKEFKDFKGNQLNSLCNQSRQADQGQSCKYYQNLFKQQNKLEIKLKNQIMDIEDIKDQGLQNNFCPYYYAMQKNDKFDLLFLPYNYLFQKNTLNSMNINLQNCIVIVDEAHNIENCAEEGFSFKIDLFQLDLAEYEIQQLFEKITSSKNYKPKFSGIDLQNILNPLIAIRFWISSLQKQKNQEMTIKDFFDQILANSQNKSQLFKQGLTLQNFKEYLYIVEKVLKEDQINLYGLDAYHQQKYFLKEYLNLFFI